MKTCSACGREKALALFYSDSNPRNKTGRQSRCVECCKAQARAQYHADPARFKAMRKAWGKKNPNRERSYTKGKREKRLEHYKAMDAAKVRRFRARHPGVGLKDKAERRAVMQRAPIWADKPAISVVYRKARELGMAVDHIVPLKHPLVCGLHVWANLQLLDRTLNSSKGNRHWPDMP